MQLSVVALVIFTLHVITGQGHPTFSYSSHLLCIKKTVKFSFIGNQMVK